MLTMTLEQTSRSGFRPYDKPYKLEILSDERGVLLRFGVGDTLDEITLTPGEARVLASALVLEAGRAEKAK